MKQNQTRRHREQADGYQKVAGQEGGWKNK